MAQLIKIGRVWYSDLRWGGKRIRRALSRDKQIAQEKLSEMETLREAARHGHAPQDVSWAAFRERYKDYSQTKDRQTHYIDMNTFNKLEREFPVHKLGDVFNVDFMDRWIARQQGHGYSNSTIKREYKALKAAARKAVEWKYIREVSFPDTRKRLKSAKGKLRFFTIDELEKLKKVCAGFWRTILYIGFYAGLRREEIRTLRWSSNIDFERNRIHIVAQDGFEPKDKERRFIPMAPALRQYLESLARPSDFVLGHEGWVPSLSYMSAEFVRLVKSVGIPNGSLHTLRHSFGSHLAMVGTPPRDIQEMMGHSSLSTTEIYLHLTPESGETAVRRLPTF